MCNHRCLTMGLLALFAGSLLTAEAKAQMGGRFGSTPSSAYRSPLTSQSVNRNFGTAGRSPGSNLGSSLGNRLQGPTLTGAPRPNYTANRNRQFGNTPMRSRSPVLSPALNMLPNATDNFSGQYLLRTQPFEAMDRQGQDFGRQLGALRQDFQMSAAAQGVTGDAFLPIRSGLTPTGHPVGFLNTGSYYP
jgi:hypothetical protein